MIEAVIRALIYVLCLVACVFLVVWVLAEIGLGIPPMVVKILWIIVALVAILILFRLLRPHAGNWLP